VGILFDEIEENRAAGFFDALTLRGFRGAKSLLNYIGRIFPAIGNVLLHVTGVI
jgi:hypothetical protein